MTGYRARQTVVAVGLSIVGLGFGVRLLVKAVAELADCCPHPSAAR